MVEKTDPACPFEASDACIENFKLHANLCFLGFAFCYRVSFLHLAVPPFLILFLILNYDIIKKHPRLLAYPKFPLPFGCVPEPFDLQLLRISFLRSHRFFSSAPWV